MVMSWKYGTHATTPLLSAELIAQVFEHTRAMDHEIHQVILEAIEGHALQIACVLIVL